MRVEEGIAEALPFEDAWFDAALAQLVVNFMSDADAGVAEMMRVTRPGGVVAAATWDYGGEMLMLRRFWDAARAINPDTQQDERQMRYCTPGELHDLGALISALFLVAQPGRLPLVARKEHWAGPLWASSICLRAPGIPRCSGA